MIMKNERFPIFYLENKRIYAHGVSLDCKYQKTVYTPEQRMGNHGFTLLAPYELARWETK
jgi:hypothetical protein